MNKATTHHMARGAERFTTTQRLFFVKKSLLPSAHSVSQGRNGPLGISMAAVVVLVVAGLVFLSVFATEYIFAAARHGKRVLKRELRSRGVDPERLGDECLDALVAQCVDTPRAEDRNEGRKFWRAFKAALRVNAGKVAAVLEGHVQPGEDDPLHEPLKKAGLLQ